MGVEARNGVDPRVGRGQPLTNPAIPSLALLTAFAAPVTPVVSPCTPGGGRGGLAADPAQDNPNQFMVEWQLPLSKRP